MIKSSLKATFQLTNLLKSYFCSQSQFLLWQQFLITVFSINTGIVQTSIPSLLSTSVSPTASLAQVLPSSQSLNITQGKVLTL